MSRRSSSECLHVSDVRSPRRMRIDEAYRRSEPECVSALLAHLADSDLDGDRVLRLARRLGGVQREQCMRAAGIDALMAEFPLSSEEGVALMCLAEALLRVPDAATVDCLIRDQLSRGDWRTHFGQGHSLFVNASAWGLLVGARLAEARDREGLAHALTRVLARGGEPLVRQGMQWAMRLLGERFVAGRDIEEALAAAHERESRGYLHSFDMLGEAALCAADARRYFDAYVHAAKVIGACAQGRGCDAVNGMSIKLSALSPRYVWSQPERIGDELLARARAICLVAREAGIGLSIDAEESDRLEPSMDVFEALARDPGLHGWDGLGFVVQAYQKRAPFVIGWLEELARERGQRLMVRLVKGAYWDQEIKRTQVDGLPDFPVFTRKAHTDVSFLACAKQLLAARPMLRPQFATHNAHTLAAVLEMAGGGERDDFELQCLFGMGEPLYDQIIADPALRRRIRIYSPVGSHSSLLPYLVRRLLENGANSSFVHRIVDARVTLDALVADPVATAIDTQGLPHPDIAAPSALFGTARRNSAGMDLSSPRVRAPLVGALDASHAREHRAEQTIAGETVSRGNCRRVENPADPRDALGVVREATPEEALATLERASAQGMEWSRLAPALRADCIERASDLLEADAHHLLPLLVREAGKTWPAAIAELREAVDFCRYYAATARGFDNATHRPLGTMVCISPWNFPLAIFTGQVVAALAAGNRVIAKPAEQTPLVAAAVVRALHAAGVPTAALQCLPGPGETVGAALVADQRIAGVLFTGSSEVAAGIHRRLAARDDDPVLIAETGGQNALIADSTALPEQLVSDVLTSAFDSAGQRCSALRLLCLQEEIADEVLALLRGAMVELCIGDPRELRTDVGPVIDASSREALERHVEQMRSRGYPVFRADPAALPSDGCFALPTLIEIDHAGVLEREHFGPVLHVLRFQADALDDLVSHIHSLGYGLTGGVHSRIGTRIEHLSRTLRVGNFYANRNIVAAVVGVQPFGGEGLSGTGPKAGGPLYLYRLIERGALPSLAGVPIRPPGRAFERLMRWLEQPSGAVDAEACATLIALGRTYRDASLAGREIVLPGPVGEDNRLHFVPVGRVHGVAANATGFLHQMLAALACGNFVTLERSESALALLPALPVEVTDRVTVGEHQASCNAVLFDGTSLAARAWRLRLAVPGSIVPVLRPTPTYDVLRLVRERSVCINTQATGGDARLLSLGD